VSICNSLLYTPAHDPSEIILICWFSAPDNMFLFFLLLFFQQFCCLVFLWKLPLLQHYAWRFITECHCSFWAILSNIHWGRIAVWEQQQLCFFIKLTCQKLRTQTLMNSFLKGPNMRASRRCVNYSRLVMCELESAPILLGKISFYLQFC